MQNFKRCFSKLIFRIYDISIRLRVVDEKNTLMHQCYFDKYRLNCCSQIHRFVTSWIDTRDHSERANLSILFEKYIPPLLEIIKNSKFKRVTPLPEMCHLKMLCHLLDCFLVKENVPSDSPKEW